MPASLAPTACFGGLPRSRLPAFLERGLLCSRAGPGTAHRTVTPHPGDCLGCAWLRVQVVACVASDLPPDPACLCLRPQQRRSQCSASPCPPPCILGHENWVGVVEQSRAPVTLPCWHASLSRKRLFPPCASTSRRKKKKEKKTNHKGSNAPPLPQRGD